MLTLLAWPWIGPDLQKILFDETLVLVVVVVVVGGMFFASLILRATGFGGEPERK